jgi:hypothetical protein
VDIDGFGMLITGSNMSGKSTFLRTVGVNAILAQTVGTVCAASWRAPFVRVRTSIGRRVSPGRNRPRRIDRGPARAMNSIDASRFL